MGMETSEEGSFLCEECSLEHLRNLIKEIKRFSESSYFFDKFELIKKHLWLSEEMGFWMDNANKSVMESVYWYYDWSLRELQKGILNHKKTLEQNIEFRKNEAI